jgi:hypothetical protein
VLLAALAAFATTATAGATDVVEDRQADEPLHAQPAAASDNDETVTATNVLVASTADEVHATLVQTIQTSAFSPSSPDPAGITYIPESDRLLISDSEVDEMAIYQGFNFFTTTRTGSGVGTGTSMAFSREPTGVSYDPSTQRLFVADDDGDRISVVSPGTDGKHGTADDVWTRFGTAVFGNTDPEGLAYDQASGHLFICDGFGTEIYELDPVNGVFGDPGDVVTHFDIGAAGADDCEGVALDAARAALLVIDPSTARIYDFTIEGALTRIIRLTAIPTTQTIFADLVLAPSSDPTDHPSKSNLWIVDRHVDNGTDPNENDGLLYEVSLPDDAPPPGASAVFMDFNGDADSDLGFYRPASGVWVFHGGQPWVHYPGLAQDLLVPADYDGDGTTDIAFYRPTTGVWVLRGLPWVHFPAASGDVLVPSDYDGDGDAEIAFYRPTTGVWVINGLPWVHFPGLEGDIPLPADYDGDGDADLAFYRPSTGVWVLRDLPWVHFPAAPDDVLVPADYDGDGDTEFAYYRPSSGVWVIDGLPWVHFPGVAGDIPVPGDYDGDGDAGIAFYRPTNGVWVLHGGAPWVHFPGLEGDIPLTLPATLRTRIVP